MENFSTIYIMHQFRSGNEKIDILLEVVMNFMEKDGKKSVLHEAAGKCIPVSFDIIIESTIKFMIFQLFCVRSCKSLRRSHKRWRRYQY